MPLAPWRRATTTVESPRRRATKSESSRGRSTRWQPSSPKPTGCGATSSPTCRTSCEPRFPPNGGRVEVRARRAPDGVTIEVSDEGPGIPASEQVRIFERFYRADHARTAADGGAGLCLAIAHWIVDLHGGQIHPERCEPH